MSFCLNDNLLLRFKPPTKSGRGRLGQEVRGHVRVEGAGVVSAVAGEAQFALLVQALQVLLWADKTERLAGGLWWWARE